MKSLFVGIVLFLVFHLSVLGQVNRSSSMFEYAINTEFKSIEEDNFISPYAMFGDSTETITTKHQRLKDYTLKVPVLNKDVQVGMFEINMQTGLATIKDNTGKLVSEKILSNEEKARFLSVDPLAEKKPWISPYVYCRNNPLRFIDPDGMDEWEIDEYGKIVNRIETDKHDAFYIVNGDGKRVDGQSITFEYGTIGQFSGTYQHGGENYGYDIYSVNGDENAQNLYVFMAENTSGLNGKQEAEWTLSKFDAGNGNTSNYLTTSHTADTEVGFSALTSTSVGNLPLIEMSHSHPGIGFALPSGLPDIPNIPPSQSGDIPNAARRVERAKAGGHPVPVFKIYSPELKRDFRYTPNSKYSDFKR